METVRKNAKAESTARTAGPTSSEHQFALLMARAGLEPELAARYGTDPLAVLAEFGLPPAAGHADLARRGTGFRLMIENLDRPVRPAGPGYGCATGVAAAPTGIPGSADTAYGCATGVAPLPHDDLAYGCATGVAPLPHDDFAYGCATGVAPLPVPEEAALA
ncbi:hypothetical protein [Streptomyces sp. NPDC050560]|uniref:hypothetical protein n=1 Tax=Streptomyces sp. NPDC050560 TaxID=3365630 RepID=UPI0037B13B4D